MTSVTFVGALTVSKRAYMGFYDDDAKRVHLLELVGPYSWAFIFYRSYCNKIVRYLSKPCDETTAADNLNDIFCKLRKNPHDGSEGLLVGWTKSEVRDVKKDEFDRLRSEVSSTMDLMRKLYEC